MTSGFAGFFAPENTEPKSRVGNAAAAHPEWVVSCPSCREPFPTREALQAHESWCVGLKREQIRSRRYLARAQTIDLRKVSSAERAMMRRLYPEDGHETPRTRAECVDGPRPCPYVSCRHHLYLDVSKKTGAVKINFPGLEPEELGVSCSLDVADKGGERLEFVGQALNMTRERVRQVEADALAKLRRANARVLTEFSEGEEQ